MLVWAALCAAVGSPFGREEGVLAQAASRRIAAGRTSLCSRIALPLEPAAEFGVPAGTVEHLALQLAAGGVDVVAAGAAHRGEHPGVQQDPLEGEDGRLA